MLVRSNCSIFIALKPEKKIEGQFWIFKCFLAQNVHPTNENSQKHQKMSKNGQNDEISSQILIALNSSKLVKNNRKLFSKIFKVF